MTLGKIIDNEKRMKSRKWNSLVIDAENKKLPSLYYLLCNKFNIGPKDINLYNKGLIKKIEKDYLLEEKKGDPAWESFKIKNIENLKVIN